MGEENEQLGEEPIGQLAMELPNDGKHNKQRAIEADQSWLEEEGET